MDPLLAFFSPGPMEMLILGIIAVLLFGKRLPEVGRSLGRGLMEFRRGLSEIESEINSATRPSGSSSSSRQVGYDGTPDAETDDHLESTAPKFEPPVAEAPAEAGADRPSEGQ